MVHAAQSAKRILSHLGVIDGIENHCHKLWADGEHLVQNHPIRSRITSWILLAGHNSVLANFCTQGSSKPTMLPCAGTDTDNLTVGIDVQGTH